MGTRADFWIESPGAIEWIGSIANDGHVSNFMEECKITNVDEFRRVITKMLKGRDDGTLPGMGWAWPWEFSGITDETYVFRMRYNKVFIFKRLYYAEDGEQGQFIDPLGDPYFTMPSMKCVGNYTKGKRNSTIWISERGIENYKDPPAPLPTLPPIVFKTCPWCEGSLV